MKTIEEKAKELYPYPEGWEWNKNEKWAIDPYKAQREAYIKGATEQKAIDKELIEMLINELYTSKAYHLGINGLDSDEEIKRKTIENDCALVRGINTTIKYVREQMEK